MPFEERFNAEDVDQKLQSDWDNEPTVEDLKQDFIQAKSSHDTQQSKIIEYYNNMHIEGNAAPKYVKGRSIVQPKLIRKQAEWRYSALSEPFLSNDEMFTLSPVTYEDKMSAEQNQMVLNYQWNTKLDKVKFIDEYVRTAVDEGTVIIRCGWKFLEEEVIEQVPIYEIVPAASQEDVQKLQNVAAILQDPIKSQNVPDQWIQAIQLSQQSGQPMVPQFSRDEPTPVQKTTANHPTYEVCRSGNVIIDPTCEGDLDRAKFVIYSFETSLSELTEAGLYTNLDKILLENSSTTPLSDGEHEAADPTSFMFQDDPRKRIVAYEYWGEWDIDGTGVTKPFVATWVGHTMIRMESNPYPDGKIPFVSVSYLPVRKSVYGQPDGALLVENQKVVGAITRGMIDVMARSANGQIGIRKDALDPVNKRRFDNGQDYEYNGGLDPRMAFYGHTYPEIPQSAPMMLQLQNQEAESLTGVKAFTGGLSGDSLGETATGVRGVLDAASKRELGILRRLAGGIERIGRKTIAMNQEFLSDEEVIRVTNQDFVTVRRDDLAGDMDLRLAISTAEEDNQKAQELAFMLQTMGQTMDVGMSNMVLSEIAKLRKMPELSKRIKDYQPQPDPMQEQLQQLEMQKLQLETAKIQAEIQNLGTDSQLDMAKVQTEGAKARQLGSDADQKNLDYVEQESGIEHGRELQKMAAQAEAQGRTKVLEGMVKAATPGNTTSQS
jgi:hypothetical protein